MDNLTNEPNGQNGQQSTENSRTGKRSFDTMISAMRTGAEDARKAAEEAIPKIKYAASSASYWAAYGVSFAVTFQWTLLKVGGGDGIKVGKEAAQQWLERVKQGKRAESPSSLPPLLGPATEDPRPGIA